MTEKELHSESLCELVHSSKCPQQLGLGPSKDRNQKFHPGLSHRQQGPKHLSFHLLPPLRIIESWITKRQDGIPSTIIFYVAIPHSILSHSTTSHSTTTPIPVTSWHTLMWNCEKCPWPSRMIFFTIKIKFWNPKNNLVERCKGNSRTPGAIRCLGREKSKSQVMFISREESSAKTKPSCHFVLNPVTGILS